MLSTNSLQTFAQPDLAKFTKKGTSWVSPGPKTLLGRSAHVKRPPMLLAHRTNASAWALRSLSMSANCIMIKKKKIPVKREKKITLPNRKCKKGISFSKKKNKEEVKSLEQQTYFPMAWKRLVPITYIMWTIKNYICRTVIYKLSNFAFSASIDDIFSTCIKWKQAIRQKLFWNVPPPEPTTPLHGAWF